MGPVEMGVTVGVKQVYESRELGEVHIQETIKVSHQCYSKSEMLDLLL